jgi:hypothetical protein
MKLQTAQRKRARMRIGLQGPSGTGKTYSALLVAYGLCPNWEKIAVIDTEHHSSELYSHLGSFNVLPIEAPFTVERCIQAVACCENAGMEVIIIDSLSHFWEGSGGILEQHAGMAGNSFTNWSKLSPVQNALVEKMLQSPAHVIVSVRSKQDYVLVDRNGKQVPQKVGLKAIQREGLEYELTLHFELDIKQNAACSKDRTGLFNGKTDFKLTTAIGKSLADWCNQGEVINPKTKLITAISESTTVADLIDLYNANPSYQEELHDEFVQRRKELQKPVPVTQIHNLQNQINHGNIATA